jgi:hypothetical protein
MNVRLPDGTVRCAEHFDASSYQSETSDPCLYCQSTPEPSADDQEWLEALSTLAVTPPRRAIQLAKIPCNRCPEPATWAIVDELSGTTYTCTDHGAEWFPDLFTSANIA